MHPDILTGRSATVILHLCNVNLVYCYSTRQSILGTATVVSELVTAAKTKFVSEMTAAKISVDKIIDLRTELRYIGVPIIAKLCMFGYNQDIATNS